MIYFDLEVSKLPDISTVDYRIYFGNSRYIKIVAEHFLKGHHRDTLDMSLNYEWLEDQGIDF